MRPGAARGDSERDTAEILTQTQGHEHSDREACVLHPGVKVG